MGGDNGPRVRFIICSRRDRVGLVLVWIVGEILCVCVFVYVSERSLCITARDARLYSAPLMSIIKRHYSPDAVHYSPGQRRFGHSFVHSFDRNGRRRKEQKKPNKQNKSTTQTRKEKINSVLVWQWALCIDGTRNVHSEFGGGEG